jgi:hypothetical protein
MFVWRGAPLPVGARAAEPSPVRRAATQSRPRCQRACVPAVLAWMNTCPPLDRSGGTIRPFKLRFSPCMVSGSGGLSPSCRSCSARNSTPKCVGDDGIRRRSNGNHFDPANVSASERMAPIVIPAARLIRSS